MIKNNMEDNRHVSMGEACKLVEVSRNGYLAWKNREQQMDSFDKELICVLHAIAEEFPYYGYKRMTKALQREGYKVNHKRIYRIMSEEKLLCKRKKFKPITT